MSMDSASVLLDRAALPSEPDSLKDIIVELNTVTNLDGIACGGVQVS